MNQTIGTAVSTYCVKDVAALFGVALMLVTSACATDSGETPDAGPSDVWDIDADGIPRFVDANYVQLDAIRRVSRYRSSIGHDYSDQFEPCRSMKHYFEPKSDVDWSTIPLYAPVSGTITRVDPEWAGTKIEIASDDYPAFRFSVFHVNSPVPHQLNEHVVAGEQLGTHIGAQTTSDISVIVNDPTRQGRRVSYFDVMTDGLFADYMARGVAAREDLIISRETRDANPLTCNDDTFVSADPIEAWVVLN